MSELTMTSIRGKEMMTYLPEYYATSRVMSSIIDSQGVEVDELQKALEGTLSQYFVSTATWGLDIWEKELGISIDPAKAIEQRRSVLFSKIRGMGTVTVSLIKSVAESYDGGTVEVTIEPDAYTFTVKFIDTLGIPPNLDDLKQAIEDIKPAHLAVVYAFKYNTFGKLQVNGITFGGIEANGFTFGQLETWDIP